MEILIVVVVLALLPAVIMNLLALLMLPVVLIWRLFD